MKYTFIENSRRGVSRIKACKDFITGSGTIVHAGDLGGFIESEYNLSQSGNAWVGETALVYGHAQVFGDAYIHGHAEVYGKAQIFEGAEISGYAKIFGNAKVYGRAKVSGQAKVFEGTHICDNAQVIDNAEVYGDALVRRSVVISDYARVRGGIYPDDTTDVRDDMTDSAQDDQTEVRNAISEIRELARFHSVDVPIKYGDGEESMVKMLPLTELEYILSVIENKEEQ